MPVRRWRWGLPLVVLMIAFVAGAAEDPVFEPKFQAFGRVDYFTPAASRLWTRKGRCLAWA